MAGRGTAPPVAPRGAPGEAGPERRDDRRTPGPPST
jgi:hypothetical protein